VAASQSPPGTAAPGRHSNGPSSAGKTTLSKGLQTAILEPYLCVGFDDFIFMSAPRYYLGADTAQQTATDGFTAQGAEMVRTSAPGDPISVTLVVGPVFRRLLDTMPAAVRALIAAPLKSRYCRCRHEARLIER
jgi:chloramphenicol 3-O phosphotransferase